MSAPDDHGLWRDELAAYALRALEQHEAAAFEGHLVGCARCRAELERLVPAVERVAESADRLEPPPQLRRRIMETVEAEAEHRPASPARRRWSWRPVPVLAFAAACAVAFVLGFALRGGGDGGPARTVPAQALTSAGSSADLVENDGGWQLDVDRMPALRGDDVYQVWVKRGDTVRPSSLFVLSRDGRAEVGVPDALRDGDLVMVTREPAGGSAAPTSAPLMQAQV